MVCDATCAYGRENNLLEKLTASFCSKTADHLIVAAGVNGLVAYLFSIGDVKVGILQGAISALVLNLTHCISHCIPGDQTDESRSALVLVGIFFASVYFFPDIATRFGREVTFYQSLKQGAISFAAIAFSNQFYSR